MTRFHTLSFSLILIVAVSSRAEAETISASAARDHVGENATVCGHVASTRFAARSKGRPTFLNLDKPYPDQIFTVVIWEEDRGKFGSPEISFDQKDICVTGEIALSRGSPEIIARTPAQIKAKGR